MIATVRSLLFPHLDNCGSSFSRRRGLLSRDDDYSTEATRAGRASCIHTVPVLRRVPTGPYVYTVPVEWYDWYSTGAVKYSTYWYVL